MRDEIGISELAELLDVSVHTLRYYEKEGLVQSVSRTDGGYRLYDIEALEKFDVIVLLRSCGISVREIKALLSDFSEEKYSVILERSYKGVCKKLEELERISDRLRLIKAYRMDGCQEGFKVMAKDDIIVTPIEIIEGGVYNSARSLYDFYKKVTRTHRIKTDESFFFTIQDGQLWFSSVRNHGYGKSVCFNKGRYLCYTYNGNIEPREIQDVLDKMKDYAISEGHCLSGTPLIELSPIKSLSLGDRDKDVISVSMKIND